jgi:predicted restriction endonuclease
MHYIPRSHNGLGIAENGVLGCRYHHEMMDNGNTGRREEMLEIMRGYLKSKYQNWDSEKLVYSKWRDI